VEVSRTICGSQLKLQLLFFATFLCGFCSLLAYRCTFFLLMYLEASPGLLLIPLEASEVGFFEFVVFL